MYIISARSETVPAPVINAMHREGVEFIFCQVSTAGDDVSRTSRSWRVGSRGVCVSRTLCVHIACVQNGESCAVVCRLYIKHVAFMHQLRVKQSISIHTSALLSCDREQRALGRAFARNSSCFFCCTICVCTRPGQTGT